MVNRNAIVATLHAFERIRAERVEVWRNVINGNGKETGRIYRGTFIALPGSHVGESRFQRKGSTHGTDRHHGHRVVGSEQRRASTRCDATNCDWAK